MNREQELFDNLTKAVAAVLKWSDEDSLQKLGLACEELLDVWNQETQPITAKSLEAIGCKYIHWNPGINGGFREYYLPVTGRGYNVGDCRLSITPENTLGSETTVWYVLPRQRIAFDHCHTIADFCTLYRLLTGKSVEDAWNTEKEETL